MSKAKYVSEIEVTDPDTKNKVGIVIYKHENGGMFGIDTSFISEFDDDVTIPDPFAGCEYKELMLLDEETLEKFIELELLQLFSSICMDRPDNFDEMIAYICRDIEETAPENDKFNSSNVTIGFRRFIQSI